MHSERKRFKKRELFLRKVQKKVEKQIETITSRTFAFIDSNPRYAHGKDSNQGKFTGKLRISRSNGRNQYYYRQVSKDYDGIYIPKKDILLAKLLAQLDYLTKISLAVNQELKAIRQYLSLVPETKAEQVYHVLQRGRSDLIDPLFETDEIFLEKWLETGYEGNPYPIEEASYITGKGEVVRSKSELIIADLLAKRGVPYRYEAPVKLIGFGVVYPDFTLLNVTERKDLYWEHFGMMDDPKYAERALKKISLYIKNGILPGKQLVMSFESRNAPLDVQCMQRLIDDAMGSGEV